MQGRAHAPRDIQLALHQDSHSTRNNGLTTQLSLRTWAWASGSSGQAGFHGVLFHSDNLQMCQSDTPNVNPSAVNDLLLNHLTIKLTRGLFIH